MMADGMDAWTVEMTVLMTVDLRVERTVVGSALYLVDSWVE